MYSKLNIDQTQIQMIFQTQEKSAPLRYILVYSHPMISFLHTHIYLAFAQTLLPNHLSSFLPQSIFELANLQRSVAY